IGLALEYLRRDEALEQRSQKRGTLQVRPGGHAQQITGKSGVPPVDLRRLDEPLSEVFEVWRHENDLTGHFQDGEPLTDGWNRNPKGCRKVGLVENLTMATGQQGKKPPKGHEIPHIGNRSHIPLEIRLQVGGEPQAARLWTREHFGETSVQQIDFGGFCEAKGQELKRSEEGRVGEDC